MKFKPSIGGDEDLEELTRWEPSAVKRGLGDGVSQKALRAVKGIFGGNQCKSQGISAFISGRNSQGDTLFLKGHSSSTSNAELKKTTA
ncbi:MAG: hypothetical protein LBT57_00275 [Puniceicoccales bacterium]|nr:hypothetical protein [Puniceicoccales bacterium]